MLATIEKAAAAGDDYSDEESTLSSQAPPPPAPHRTPTQSKIPSFRTTNVVKTNGEFEQQVALVTTIKVSFGFNIHFLYSI